MNASVNIKPSVIALLIAAIIAWFIYDNAKKAKKAAAADAAPAQPQPVKPKPAPTAEYSTGTARPMARPGETLHKPKTAINPRRASNTPSATERAQAIFDKASAAGIDAMKAEFNRRNGAEN